jgi:hypothetical protein
VHQNRISGSREINFKKFHVLNFSKLSKINEQNTFLALINSKIKIFSKFKKTDDHINYLAKFVEQLFSKTHLDASESAKNTLFCDVTKVKNFDKKCFILSKNKQKNPFKHFRFGRSKSPVKGLNRNRHLLFIRFFVLLFFFYKYYTTVQINFVFGYSHYKKL